jgi:hypothetical protein
MTAKQATSRVRAVLALRTKDARELARKVKPPSARPMPPHDPRSLYNPPAMPATARHIPKPAPVEMIETVANFESVCICGNNIARGDNIVILAGAPKHVRCPVKRPPSAMPLRAACPVDLEPGACPDCRARSNETPCPIHRVTSPDFGSLPKPVPTVNQKPRMSGRPASKCRRCGGFHHGKKCLSK